MRNRAMVIGLLALGACAGTAVPAPPLPLAPATIVETLAQTDAGPYTTEPQQPR